MIAEPALVTDPRQGEIWWAEAEDKRRPVLVVTRSEAVPVLDRIVVAPLTRTVRGIPGELSLGPEDGLPAACAAWVAGATAVGATAAGATATW